MCVCVCLCVYLFMYPRGGVHCWISFLDFIYFLFVVVFFLFELFFLTVSLSFLITILLFVTVVMNNGCAYLFIFCCRGMNPIM